MSKRAASYDIDQKTFQEKQRNNNGGVIDPQGQHMVGRKIFKIAKGQIQQEKRGNDKIDLKIDGLFNNKINQIKINEKSDKNEPSSNSLFSIPSFANPFSQNITSIFGINNGVGLFNQKDNNETQKRDDKKNQANNNNEVVKSNNIFNNSKPIQGKASLFGNTSNKNSQSNPTQKKSINLFANPFQQNQNSKGLLFGHLFKNQGNQQSIFNFGGNSANNNFSLLGGNQKPFEPAEVKNNENQDEGDSKQLQNQQQMSVDPSKSTAKFEYKEELKILKTFNITKFKKDKGQLVENVTGTIAYDDKLKFHLFIVKMPTTKMTICSGLLLKKKSLVKKMNGKVQSLQITIYCMKVKDKKNQLEPLKIKIQISSNDKNSDNDNDKGNYAEEYFKLLEQIIEGKTES